MDSSQLGEIANAVHAKVRGSSFYVALRILPAVQREAMFAVYSFCRDVDDVADEPGPTDARQAELERWRDDIAAMYHGKITHRTQSLEGPTRQFGLRREDFLAVIDGMEMDLSGLMLAPDFARLDVYCERVASAPGRLSVRVFGMPEEEGVALAHHLGRALQLTNILRDIDEDADIGRLYLPREALSAAGIGSLEPRQAVSDLRIGAACMPVVEKARRHFSEARVIMARLPRAQVRTPLLMCEAYDSILAKLERRGFLPPRERMRLGKFTMFSLLLRYGIV
jgi:presqualene diphosphate synthase